MLMEQDPVNVFSPWNSFNLGTTLPSKENALLSETDIFGKKNLFNHAPSNTSSYRHSDSSSPMSWSEVDNSSTSTGSRLSGIYDNGFSQEISNLWNQIEKDTNSGNLGLDHLKELASKDLSPCNNLYGRETNDCTSSFNPIGTSCTTTSTYSSHLFGPLESYQKPDNFLLLDSTPAPTGADASTLFKEILQSTNTLNSSKDSSYWPMLGGGNCYDLNDPSALELSLANTGNALLSPFNPLPTDSNAQKNFLENLKRLRDLNELTSELNLNPNLDQSGSLFNGDVPFAAEEPHQNLPPPAAAFGDMFFINVDGGGGYAGDKSRPHCAPSQIHLPPSLPQGRSNYREKTLPPRQQDHGNNQFLLAKAEPNYGLYSDSSLKNAMSADLLASPLPNISSKDLYLPGAEVATRKENWSNLTLPGLSAVKSNTDRFPPYAVPFSEEQPTESNVPFRPNGQSRPPIAGHRAPFAAGRKVDNSFQTTTPPFRAAPQSFPQTNGVARPLRPYPPPQVEFNPPRQSLELNQSIEDCYEQFAQLESERKQVDLDLSNGFPGLKISSTNNLPIPRLPPSPSRVDRLIIDNFREHSKVVTLIGVMQGLRNSQFHSGVHKVVAYWHVAILEVQGKRNKEIISAFNCSGFMSANKYDYDMHSLVEAIRSLSKACRSARTALFCALALTNGGRQVSAAVLPADPIATSDESGAEDDDPFEFILSLQAARVPETGLGEGTGSIDAKGESSSRKSSVDQDDRKILRRATVSPADKPIARNLDPAD